MMLLEFVIVTLCYCLSAVAQNTPALTVSVYDKSAVVPGFIYLAVTGYQAASGPYVFDLNGVSHTSFDVVPLSPFLL